MAAASAIGTSHVASGSPCQDAHAWRIIPTAEGPVLVAVVSDGAGTAARSQEGAARACKSLVSMVSLTVVEQGVRGITRQSIVDWIVAFQAEIGTAALDSGARPRDYACTLVGAVIGPEWSVFFQVGDGTIVARSATDPDYCWIFWPESGEYANTTFFVTEERAADHLQFEGAHLHYEEVALLTDGLQRLVLDLGERTVHQPFFASMFRVLQGAEAPPNEVLSERLAAYLVSDLVNARADDDKTLVLLRIEAKP